ncbi:MAG: ribonuclease R [Syntrophobacterales bacterium]|nr:MAG: ribonuclease R [Syntrophobacterales bacterium]
MSRKRRPEPRDIDRRVVVELLKRENHPLVLRDLVRRLDLSHEEKRMLKVLLNEMTSEGQILRIKGRRYILPSRMNTVVGRLQCHPDGYGFVIVEDGNQPDIFIKPRDIGEAMHGDRVAVRIEDLRKRRGKGREGRIVRILERGTKRIVGRFKPGDGFGRVVPDDDRYLFEAIIPKNRTMKAREDQVVVTEIIEYPTIAKNPVGRIIHILGYPGDPEIVPRIVIGEYDLPHGFPTPVIREVKAIRQKVRDEEIVGRVDLRSKVTVTIDGENARDFDDAVSIEERDGGYILWVSISDVGSYVNPGTHLDKEAYRRGTSVYFPDRVIPMFPPELSNGICCLHPHMDRLTLTVALRFDGEGNVGDCDVFKSVIQSDARLTYGAVRRILVDRDTEEMGRYEKLLPSLEAMGRLCSLLAVKRRERGSLDFDLPEPEIILNLQGEAQEIIKAERNFAHQIIEEFMIAANEAIAIKLTQAGFPLLYRVHEEPDVDKIRDFGRFIALLGYRLKMRRPNGPRQFQRLLEEVRGKPEERLVNTVLLRSMKQAHYSDKNLSHYGLSLDCYTHFTSPIRRYPDLLVHRQLNKIIEGGYPSKEDFSQRAQHLSERERVAMEAEREILKRYRVKFMEQRIGEQFDGIISGVNPFGFFVELGEVFVEGLVHIGSLPDDYFLYDEKGYRLIGKHSKKIFRIGDRLRIAVERVDSEKQQIDFRLIG